MIVLKATVIQYQSLNNYTNGRSTLNFAKDNNDNFIVGLEVLGDKDFEEIRTKLNELKQIEYIEPKIVIL